MPFGASRAGLMSTRVDAIPDSAISHYDATDSGSVTTSNGSITSVEDLIGNRDLSPTDDPQLVSSGISGNASFETDGDNDEGLINTDTYVNDEDFAVVMVYEIQESVNSNQFLFGTGGGGGRDGIQDDDGGEFQHFRGDINNENSGYSPDGNAHILVWVCESDGTTDLRIDGTAQGEISADGTDMLGLSLGRRAPNDETITIPINSQYGEVIILEDYSDSDITDVEQQLSDKWDISI